jgi:predicted phage terminase large subunit-like protein
LVKLDAAGERLLRLELARRSFWEYCKLMLPVQYKDDRPWLKKMCDSMQAFWEQDTNKFMVINAPPRFCKSLSGQMFAAWVLGKDPTNQVMTGSYNEILASQFSKRVRTAIQTPVGQSHQIQFGDIFPNVRINKGDAAAGMWALEGSPVPSYLATSPGGTAVGMGCLTGETKVCCLGGEKTIKEIYDNREPVKVVSFNIETGEIEEDYAVAAMETKQEETFEIELSDGRKINATDTHRFYIEGYGFRSVSWLMQKMREEEAERENRSLSELLQREQGHNGRFRMRILREDIQEICSRTEKNFSYGNENEVLYERLLVKGKRSFTEEELRRAEVYREERLPDGIYQEEVCNKRERWKMCGLWSREKSFYPSQRRRQEQQRRREPDSSVFELPYEIAQVKAISRRVARENVYDITVLNNKNFFANGILTHNCTLLFVDDLIKLSEEAYNVTKKEALSEWFFNTMLTRVERNWKVIIIMQRWATDDLAGIILDLYPDCVHIDFEAWEDMPDGSKKFLCPEILGEASLAAKIKGMNPDIVEAVYRQRPVDVSGRLFHEFNEYDPKEVYPTQGELVYAVTDTADKGSNFLCTGIYIERDGIAYLLDYVLSDSQMEITEPMVARKLDQWGVKVMFTEANNGGRLFARNVRRLMRDKSCVFSDKVQTTNKEARIMAGYAWCQNNIWFPRGWKVSWSDLHSQIMKYSAMSKGQDDDAVDMLNYIYMMCTQQQAVVQTEYSTQAAFTYSQYYNEPETAQLVQNSYEGW